MSNTGPKLTFTVLRKLECLQKFTKIFIYVFLKNSVHGKSFLIRSPDSVGIKYFY